MLWMAFVLRGENYPHYYRPSPVLTVICYSSIPHATAFGSLSAGRGSSMEVNSESSLPDTVNAAVGLSDPQYVSQRRTMLDTVNRLRATG